MDDWHHNPPLDPMPLLARWLDEAHAAQASPNWNAMVVATVARQGTEVWPSARVVLCKHVDTEQGYLVFYTNYRSRKGGELAEHAQAAAVFHWDHAGRQARVEGRVLPSPAEESDAYFATRGRGSRLGAWASDQSEPIASRAALMARLDEVQQRFGDGGDGGPPRPPHWGGYRLWASAVELWQDGEHRLHDRVRWIRTVVRGDGDELGVGEWTSTRLQP